MKRTKDNIIHESIFCPKVGCYGIKEPVSTILLLAHSTRSKRLPKTKGGRDGENAAMQKARCHACRCVDKRFRIKERYAV
jgi:hypothetical protein